LSHTKHATKKSPNTLLGDRRDNLLKPLLTLSCVYFSTPSHKDTEQSYSTRTHPLSPRPSWYG